MIMNIYCCPRCVLSSTGKHREKQSQLKQDECQADGCLSDERLCLRVLVIDPVVGSCRQLEDYDLPPHLEVLHG